MLTAASKLVRRSLPFHKPGWLAIIARTIGKKQALEELSAREMMVAVRKRTRNAAAVLKVDCGYFLVSQPQHVGESLIHGVTKMARACQGLELRRSQSKVDSIF